MTHGKLTRSREHQEMRNACRIYLTVILGCGAGLLVWGSILPTAAGPFAWSLFGFWLVLSLAAEIFWLETRSGSGMISMGLAVNTASLFVLPPHLVLTVGALSVGLADLLLHRRGMLKSSFNAAQTVVTLSGCMAVLRIFTGSFSGMGSSAFLLDPEAFLVVGLVFFVLNTALVSGVIALHQGRSFWPVWRENFGYGYQVLSSAVLSCLAVALVLGTEVLGYVSGLLFLLFFFFVRDSYHRFLQARSLRAREG